MHTQAANQTWLTLPSNLPHELQQLLPATIKEMVGVIGLPATLSIVNERGGIRLSIPTKSQPQHWLHALIGPEALTALVNYYGGEEIDIPRCACVLQAIKEQHIVNAFANGHSNAQLARAFGYTERGIRKLRKRVEQPKNLQQSPLF